jgi:hypothetical protein
MRRENINAAFWLEKIRFLNYFKGPGFERRCVSLAQAFRITPHLFT